MEDETWSMVQTKGNQFVVNGQSFYVNGFNTYWLMKFAVDQSSRGKVNEVFQQASSIGLTVCCTWAFNDGQGQALQKSPSIYDEEVFKNLLLSANSDNAVLKIADFGFARNRRSPKTIVGFPFSECNRLRNAEDGSQEDNLLFSLDDVSNGPDKPSMKSTVGFSSGGFV